MDTKEVIYDLYNNEKKKAKEKISYKCKTCLKKQFGKKYTLTKTMQETRKSQFRS